MTMPHERTRALRFAGELLRAVLADESLPREVRDQATAVLRHYPSPQEIKHIANLSARDKTLFGLATWFQPESDTQS